jgi:hypothetical protein
MDAIDRLILNTASRISVTVYNAPTGDSIWLEFSVPVTDEIMAPVDRILNINGFWNIGRKRMDGGRFCINCPTTYKGLDVAKAICQIWDEKSIKYVLRNGFAPGEIEVVAEN